MIVLFVTIAVLVISPDTVRPAPIHAANACAASLVEKSVIINRTPSRYSCGGNGRATSASHVVYAHGMVEPYVAVDFRPPNSQLLFRRAARGLRAP